VFVGVGVRVFVGVGDGPAVFVDVGVRVFVGVGVFVRVAVAVRVFVAVGVFVRVAVAVDVLVGPGVLVRVGVEVCVRVAVGVCVRVGVRVAVFVRVGVRVAVFVRVGVGGVPQLTVSGVTFAGMFGNAELLLLKPDPPLFSVLSGTRLNELTEVALPHVNDSSTSDPAALLTGRGGRIPDASAWLIWPSVPLGLSGLLSGNALSTQVISLAVVPGLYCPPFVTSCE
jgi:hypothetical protein